MNDFSIESLKKSLDYYGIDMHQDLVDFFSGKYPLEYGTLFIQKNREVRVIEERLYSISRDELNTHEKAWLDFDVVFSPMWDRFDFKEDVILAEKNGEEPPTRLIPFATLFAGDMLCFYFKDSERPQIVVWLHEQSDVDDAHIELVADNLEQFFEEAIAKSVINIFNPESEEYNEEKQWELVEHLQENEEEIEMYVDDFIYLMNHVYLENDVDCEIDLFLEREHRYLVFKIISSFEKMEKIEPIYSWGKFLFMDDSIEDTLLASKNFSEKDKLKEYVLYFLKDFRPNETNEVILMKQRNATKLLNSL